MGQFTVSPATKVMNYLAKFSILLLLAGLSWGCSSSSSGERAKPGVAVERTCVLTQTIPTVDADTATIDAYEASLPEFLPTLECKADFDALASTPLEGGIAGVRAIKFVINRWDQSGGKVGRLYFQNTKRYSIHSEFIAKSGEFKSVATGNFESNYTGSYDERQFYLGSIAYYEGPGVWAVDMAAIDTATPQIMHEIFQVITEQKAFFRKALAFHPMSPIQEAMAVQLDKSIPIISNDELYAGTDYQPLSLASAIGYLTFMTEADISSGTWVSTNAIVVLDLPPNDIGVVAGIITEQFQSDLSHVNMLSKNRKTPNMGLRHALTNPDLLKYKDQLVRLTVDANFWKVEPATKAEFDGYVNQKRPEEVVLEAMDRDQRDIVNVEDILPGYLALNGASTSTKATVRDAIKKVVRTWGGKTVNYAIMAQVEGIPMQRAFGIPIVHYLEFMENNGLFDLFKAYQADPNFEDPYFRQEALRELRNAIMKGKIDQTLQAALKTKLAAEYVGSDGTPAKMRFRTSTNSEDLDAFPCAGCYESHTGDPANWENVLDAIRLAYSSIWLFRTYEEREYYGVDHTTVGMSLLVHAYFPNETANGVAVTANITDLSQTSALGYTINVAYGGDAEVVALPDGVLTDQFIYYPLASGNTTRYLQHWNQPLPAGRTNVLTEVEIGQLGAVLTKINTVFRLAYTLDSGWFAMDVEFKFAPQDERGIPTTTSTLWIKQARPYPDPNATTGTGATTTGAAGATSTGAAGATSTGAAGATTK